MFTLCKAQNIHVFTSHFLLIESIFNDAVSNCRSRGSAVRKLFGCPVLPHGQVFHFHILNPIFLVLRYSVGSHSLLSPRSFLLCMYWPKFLNPKNPCCISRWLSWPRGHWEFQHFPLSVLRGKGCLEYTLWGVALLTIRWHCRLLFLHL